MRDYGIFQQNWILIREGIYMICLKGNVDLKEKNVEEKIKF